MKFRIQGFIKIDFNFILFFEFKFYELRIKRTRFASSEDIQKNV